MQILGIEQFTALDYPGKLASVIFTGGCNFRCPFCYNPELVLPEILAKRTDEIIPWEAVKNFLESRRGKLDGVVFCGGEPTLQPDLYQKIKEVKEMGFAVKLDTNGRDFQIVKKLVDEGLVDYVAVDLKADWQNYDFLTGGRADEDFLKNYKQLLRFLIEGNKVDYEFRTTIIKGYHDKFFENMVKIISGAKKYYIQNFRSDVTLDPDFEGESFTKQELEELKKIAEKYVDFVGIRA